MPIRIRSNFSLNSETEILKSKRGVFSLFLSTKLLKTKFFTGTSVADPRNSGTDLDADPDPRIHTSD